MPIKFISKIISGGQTGADRAALDAAIDLDIPHGGWVAKGRKAEDGTVPDKYQLQEMPTGSNPSRTEQNVIDSDGSLILSHGKLTGGSALTLKLAEKHGRPCLHIDFFKSNGFKVAQEINDWIAESGIKILNVAGPRTSEDPKIYDATYKILKTAYHLSLVESGMHTGVRSGKRPKTVDDAVERLIAELSLKDKARIARMSREDASALPVNLGDYIWRVFGIGDDNEELVESCRLAANADYLRRANTIDVITDALWKKLRQTYNLRPVN